MTILSEYFKCVHLWYYRFAVQVLEEECQNDKPQLKRNSSTAKELGETFRNVSSGVWPVKEGFGEGSCTVYSGCMASVLLSARVNPDHSIWQLREGLIRVGHPQHLKLCLVALKSIFRNELFMSV